MGTFTFTQEGLINKILSDTNLLSCSPNHTPATALLLWDRIQTAEPFKELWHYSSIVRMLLFLANNSRPDIAFATHQCAHFAYNTKQSHATAVKAIIWCLKGTSKQVTCLLATTQFGARLFCGLRLCRTLELQIP